MSDRYPDVRLRIINTTYTTDIVRCGPGRRRAPCRVCRGAAHPRCLRLPHVSDYGGTTSYLEVLQRSCCSSATEPYSTRQTLAWAPLCRTRRSTSSSGAMRERTRSAQCAQRSGRDGDPGETTRLLIAQRLTPAAAARAPQAGRRPRRGLLQRPRYPRAPLNGVRETQFLRHANPAPTTPRSHLLAPSQPRAGRRHASPHGTPSPGAPRPPGSTRCPSTRNSPSTSCRR